MGNVQLREVAFARSGDKGNTVNIGLFAARPEWYEVFVREVTPERVKEHFRGLVEGEVECYLMPNIHAMNFVLRGHWLVEALLLSEWTIWANALGPIFCAWKLKQTKLDLG